MDKITIILILFLFSCKEDKITIAKKAELNNDSVAEYPISKGCHIDNWSEMDSADRSTIYEDTVPVFLVEFAKKNKFPYPDTLGGCAACGYCSYIKLSHDWNYFAYESMYTKHTCEIFIFKKSDNRFILLDTLLGTAICTDSIPGKEVYQLALLEYYWEDERPQNVEIYRFKKWKFYLKETIVADQVEEFVYE